MNTRYLVTLLYLVLFLIVPGPGPVRAQWGVDIQPIPPPGPDSQRQDGVPRGTVTQHQWESQVFSGTMRDYWIYVPAQYDPSTPAALIVFQDGHAYVSEDGAHRVPIVLDNLIHRGDIPVTIGLFINPGHAGPTPPENPFRSSNRSYEYDKLTDEYARFLIEEMIPEVARQYNLSDDPAMRTIGGLSSGAICAFTVAWQRPDAFRNVISHIGSYTDIYGGHEYPALIRRSAKRDIKIFIQDGTNDLNLIYGNWWLANLQMVSALDFRAYDYQFVAGDGGHSGDHGGALLPETLRWLFADH
jgi:enterochelin esterase family protein